MDDSIIYLTVKELAEEAGVTPAQVRKHVKEGLLDSTIGQNTGMYYKNNPQYGGVVVTQGKCRAQLFRPDQVEAYVDLMKDFIPEDGRKGAEHPRRSGTEANKGLSCELASKMCGISGATMRTAVKVGAIKVLNKMPIRISKHVVEKYAADMEDRVTLKEAAEIMGMTVSSIRSLVESGHLERVFCYMSYVYLSGKQVNAAAEKYKKTHVPTPRGAYPQLRRIK